MIAAFEGFSTESIQFLADLANNNERSWFQPRKAEFERLLRDPLEQLCLALSERFEARGLPLQADPKRSPFRIYRDTRFSRDKSPYKTHLGASFSWVGAAAEPVADGGPHGNGGYFHFQPGDMFAGGGMWMPEKARIDAFRRLVIDDPERVRGALGDPAFVTAFDRAHSDDALRRVPAGYPADHPLADLLRWKSVSFGRRLSDAEVCSPELPDRLVDLYGAATPVFRLLAGLA